MGIPDHLTCLLRNLYAGQEATVSTGHEIMDWFQIGKGICQGCILSPYLFNFYAEYIIQNAGLDEAQAGVKMGPIKDRNGMDLTEGEDIKKRWQEYTEELYKKDPHDPDDHDGVITDILECEVEWALESITTKKASGGDRIPVELFQILKDDAAKVMHSICQQILKTQQWPQDRKRSVFIPIPKKGNAKECSNYRTIALISHASKVMLKILQARLQQYVNHELPGVQAGFRKGRGTRDQIANIRWIMEKAKEYTAQV